MSELLPAPRRRAIDFSAVDVRFLLRRFPDLLAIRKDDWDEVGEKVAQQFHNASHRQGFKAAGRKRDSKTVWAQTRDELSAIILGKESRHDEMRRRLIDTPPTSTSSLLTSLSFSLSGSLGIPLTTITPMVAVVLYHGATGGFDSKA